MEIVDSILMALQELGRVAPRPFESKYAWYKRVKGINNMQFERGIRYMENKALIKVISKNGQRFIQLTKSGQLQALLSKAKKKEKQEWDGKWRLIIFDIPEDAKDKRQLFRNLLKTNGFFKLQESVYINPFPLNRSAITYLNKTLLINYIRILRIDDMDNDKFLKKYFRL